jgi:type I restriction enzyme S subunit
MNYDIVTLGDVCEFLDSQRVPITESDRKPGPYPYYGANGQQDSIDSYIFDEPLVLLAEDGGYFGSKDRPIAYKVTGKCWVNNHAHVLRPKSNIDVDYLHRVLSYYDVTKYVNGTTRQKLTKGNAENISFPLPPLTEQKRIASLLARADRLRHLRRTAHELGESLLQSVFLEMFGDPVSNSRHWNQEAIKDLGKVTTGSTPPSKAEGMFGGVVPFITPGDLTVDTLNSQRYVTEDGAKKSRVVRAGSTLVCCIGATIGKTDIAKTKCAFNQQINAIEWGKKINDEFGVTLMKFFSKLIADRGSSTTLPILKKSEFEEIVIPVPPLSLQEEFAGFVGAERRSARTASVESLRRRMSESERQVEGLFESLLSESFEIKV